MKGRWDWIVGWLVGFATGVFTVTVARTLWSWWL